MFYLNIYIAPFQTSRPTQRRFALDSQEYRNRNLKISKALLKSQAHQGTSLFTSTSVWQNMSHEDRLKRCGLISLYRRRSRQDMIQALKNIIGKEAAGLYRENFFE